MRGRMRWLTRTFEVELVTFMLVRARLSFIMDIESKRKAPSTSIPCQRCPFSSAELLNTWNWQSQSIRNSTKIPFPRPLLSDYCWRLRNEDITITNQNLWVIEQYASLVVPSEPEFGISENLWSAQSSFRFKILIETLFKADKIFGCGSFYHSHFFGNEWDLVVTIQGPLITGWPMTINRK